MSEQQTPQKRDGHLVVYLAWPMLAGLGLASVLAVSIGGVVLIASGDWRTSGTVAGVVWFAVLGAATVVLACCGYTKCGCGKAGRVPRSRRCTHRCPT